MKPACHNHKKIQMNVSFPEPSLAWSILEEWQRDCALIVNPIRGRVTRREACLTIEVSGPAEQVDDFARLSTLWGTPEQTLSASVA